MRLLRLASLLVLAVVSVVSPAAAVVTRMAEVVVDGSATLPPDLAQPEGRTRWDLTGVTLGRGWSRVIDEKDAIVAVRDEGGASESLARSAVSYSDPAGSGGAARWLFPQRFAPELGGQSHEVLRIDETRAGSQMRRRIDVERVGIGWLELPTGPREVFLQRAVVTEQAMDGSTPKAGRVVHRWVDPVAGVVAEVWGPAAPGAKTRLAVESATIRTDLAAVATLTKLYETQVISPVQSSIGYGWDRGAISIPGLTTPSFATANALVASSVWDFSATSVRHAVSGTTMASATATIAGTGSQFTAELAVGARISLSSTPTSYALVTAIANDTSLTVDTPLGNGTVQSILRKSGELASTNVSISSAETCNSERCGYNLYHSDPSMFLDREDRDFDFPATLSRTNAASQRIETPGSDVTYWLRGGAQAEGTGGALGEGESKFCYQTEGSETRTPVPLWRFAHLDAGGYYLQVAPADSWSSAVVSSCEQDLWAQNCSNSGGLTLYNKVCSGHQGVQKSDVLKSGVVVTPTGHTFNAVLVRDVVDYCVYLTRLGSLCTFKTADVRGVIYLWQTPYLGTLVRVNSLEAAPPSNLADLPDPTTLNFTKIRETNISFGLFPPRTIQVTGTTGTTVSLAWDPGLDTHRISGFKVYWDTDSGSSTGYAFDSDPLHQGGQVAFLGNTATISGLTPGTTYYFTITSKSSFTNPSTAAVTLYESPLYPTQISGDPGFIYPIEVQAATTGAGCTPTTQVTGLRVDRDGAGIRVCWNAIADACATGYRVLGAASPSSDAGFTTAGDTVGLETCWTGNPAASYLLVVARDSGGATGPWGHFGR